MTALTIGPTNVASTTLPNTANALTANTGSFTAVTADTLIGQSTGFGEMFSMFGFGTTTAWPGLNAMGDPDGYGWIWDVSTLEGQQLLGGTWASSLVWHTSVGSIVADVHVRFSLYNAVTGTHKTIGSIVATGQTFTTTAGSVPISGTLPSMTCGAGDRLYMDCWVNITSNSTGSNSATLKFGGIATTLVINVGYTTPGFQALSVAQLATRYSFGDFCFHDGSAYLLIEKNLDTVPIQQTLFKIARFEGVKKTGESVNERHISLKIRVLGTSRADLERKVDALTQAFDARQQNLTLHSTDARYFIADCVSLKVPLPPGAVLSTVATAEFVCQQPYAYAAASSYSSGNLTMVSAGGGTWNLPAASNPLAVPSGGTVLSRPVITITNETATNATTLSAALSSGTAYTSLSIASLPSAAAAGAIFLLSNGTTTQRVTLSANALVGATTLSVTSFTANANYAIGAFCGLDIYITAFTLSQQPDGQILTVSSINNTIVGNSQSLTIDCDPTDTAGYTVIPSATNNPIAFSGSFPVLEPGVTSLALNVTCSNQPTLLIQITWNARWLA